LVALGQPIIVSGNRRMSNVSRQPSSLEESYAWCRRLVRRHFRRWNWAASNLSRPTQDHLAAVLALAVRSASFLDLRLSSTVRRERWTTFREQLRQGFRGTPANLPHDLAAALATAAEYRIPREFYFDMLRGGEMGFRVQRFEAFDQWRQLACRIGGAAVLAAAPVVEVTHGGFEPAAVKCGQGIFLTWLLGNCARDSQWLATYVPRRDAEAFQVDIEALDPEQPPDGWGALVAKELYRIERILNDGQQLLEYLDYDGRRVLISVLAGVGALVEQMRANPIALLVRENRLASRTALGLRARHMLGTEAGAHTFRAAGSQPSH
jgi:phytoene/squalene synthetase